MKGPPAENERRLLAALCQQALSAAQRQAIARFLSTHDFADPEHHAVFRALTPLLSVASENLRELLATRVTLLGFPDIELDHFFSAPPPSPEEVSAMLQQR